MAFKLKSPFNVTEVKPTLGKGGVVGQGSSSGVVQGLANVDIASAEGNQTVKPEPNNQTVDNLVKKADEGVPLGLNPKQEARFKTRKYKKGLRDDARFDRQTKKAENIYERNQFENLDGGFKNPEKDAGIKSDRAEKSLELDSKFKILESDLPLEEKEKMINNIDSKSKFSNTKKSKDKEKKSAPKDNLVMRSKEEEFKNPLLKMKGKPNRAGTPVRMLKSMEDTTPMKYKSVRKAGKENLMSALAKQGEVDEPKGKIGKAIENFKTRNELVSYKKENSDAVVVTTKKKAKKAEKKQSKSESNKGGKVVMDRKVSVKF